ncbi:MAG TPA: type II secretion system protein N [Steroidobacteraceae bacterium]|nr:type II secretion system protein N [Steroidobacteraceae bacterium]
MAWMFKNRRANAPLLLSALLCVGIAVQATVTLRRLSGGPRLASAALPAGRGGAAAAALLELRRIRGAHLFGVAPSEGHTGAVSASALVLTGIIAAGDPRRGAAIIGSSTASAHLYQAGAAVAPGAILAEVFADHVTLERAGQRVALRLPQARGGIRRKGPPPPPPMLARAMADAGLDDADQEPPPPTPLTNAATVVSAFSAHRVSVDGQSGLRIMNTGINAKALAALGLAPGDVILQVNGQPVGNTHADLMTALQSNATLLIDRDGNNVGVSIDPSTAAWAAELVRASVPQ